MPDDVQDARETKILSDILALALDEQPGVSAAALDAIKQRARADGVTGGALKQIFLKLHLAEPPRPEAPDDGDDLSHMALTRARLRITELTSQVAHVERLRRQDLIRLRIEARQGRVLAMIAGGLVGAAAASVVAVAVVLLA